MAHGRHIKILGRGNPQQLGSPAVVESMLTSLVDELGMRLLGQPQMFEVEQEIAKLNVEPFEDEGGVTDIAVLSTSHISVHTWPLQREFVMDVYSCRPFDPDDVRRALLSDLSASDLQLTDLSFALRRTPAAVGLAAAPGS